jgi:hypothetical protein
VAELVGEGERVAVVELVGVVDVEAERVGDGVGDAVGVVDWLADGVAVVELVGVVDGVVDGEAVRVVEGVGD